MATSVPAIRSADRAWWASCLAAGLLIVLPALATHHPPLLDLPAHEARIGVLHEILLAHHASPYYRIDTFFLPDIAFDAVGLGLSLLFPPLLVGRIFVIATLILGFTGVLALRAALGERRDPAIPLLVALCAYNLNLLTGLLSYNLGAALMFWALAWRLRAMQARPLPRFAVGAGFGVALLFCHLAVFGLYALVLGGMILERLFRREIRMRTVVLIALELVPALLLYQFMSKAGQGGIEYDQPFLRMKFFNAIEAVTSGDPYADLAFLVGAIAVAVLVGSGRLRLDPVMRTPAVLLVLVYVVLPASIDGGANVDSRIVMVVAMVLAAGLRFAPARTGWRRVAVWTLALALVVKQVTLGLAWAGEGRQLAEIAAKMSALPRGAILTQAKCVPHSFDIPGIYRTLELPLGHVAAFAAQADQRFVGNSWTLKGQQPIAARSAYVPFQHASARHLAGNCSPAAMHLVLAATRAAWHSLPAAPGARPPVYLLLLRPPQPKMLAAAAPLIATIGPVEIYAAAP